jgi:hypothetical protein
VQFEKKKKKKDKDKLLILPWCWQVCGEKETYTIIAVVKTRTICINIKSSQIFSCEHGSRI